MLIMIKLHNNPLELFQDAKIRFFFNVENVPCGVYDFLTSVLLVCGEALRGQLLVFGARPAVVGIGVDADAATRDEKPGDLDIFGIHEADEVLHDDVYAVFVEVAVVAETEQVELQTFAFHHADVGNVADAYFGKVGLAGNGAEAGEFRTVEAHPIVVLGVFVLKGFKHLGCIVVAVSGFFAQLLQAFAFTIAHKSNILNGL